MGMADCRQSAGEAARRVEQARALKAQALKAQARKGGLRFAAYLPPGLAEWVLELVEQGVFLDPSEVVFAILSEHRDLAPHADLRRESLRRSLAAASDDPRPPVPHDEVIERIRKKLAGGRMPPAEWQKVADDDR